MINPADTVFVLFSTAFVMLMTPGLAFFYGGMVRKKNVLSVLMQCLYYYACYCAYIGFFGYSLSFHPGKGFWEVLAWFGLNGVRLHICGYSATIPHQAL